MLRRRPSLALVLAALALFVALGGTSLASPVAEVATSTANKAAQALGLSKKALKTAKSAAKRAKSATATAKKASALATAANANAKAAGAAAGRALAGQAGLLPRTGTAADAAKLGGRPASSYSRTLTFVRNVPIPASGTTSVDLATFGSVRLVGRCAAGTPSATAIDAVATASGVTVSTPSHGQVKPASGGTAVVISPDTFWVTPVALNTAGGHNALGTIEEETSPADAPGTCRFAGALSPNA